MAKRNLENVYIKDNRSTNDVFRKGYDGIRWDKKGLEKAIKEEGKKGRIYGHFT